MVVSALVAVGVVTVACARLVLGWALE